MRKTLAHLTDHSVLLYRHNQGRAFSYPPPPPSTTQHTIVWQYQYNYSHITSSTAHIHTWQHMPYVRACLTSKSNLHTSQYPCPLQSCSVGSSCEAPEPLVLVSRCRSTNPYAIGMWRGGCWSWGKEVEHSCFSHLTVRGRRCQGPGQPKRWINPWTA